MISVFISYAHADEKLKEELLGHLAALRREGLIGVWHDRKLKPGEHLDSAIEAELKSVRALSVLTTAPKERCNAHSLGPRRGSAK